MKKLILATIILLIILSACHNNNPMPTHIENEKAEPTVTITMEPELDPVEEVILRMTMEEKIGQLFMVAYRNDQQGYPVLAMDDTITESLKKYKPGGVILFSENIQNIPQTVALIDGFQKASEIPLFIAVDEEGGLVSRITKSSEMHATVFPNNAVIGKKGDTKLAKDIAAAISLEIASLGFNMNFAPIADINTNPNNPVIGKRAYGSDPEVVRKMVSAAVSGMQSNSVSSVLKHFPGHGDTVNDSHDGTASVSHSMERLLSIELLPFMDGITAGADGVMTAHILTPEIPGDNVPATLKPEILTGILREELGFEGLVITDAMNMGAITQHYEPGEAAVRAILAGADIILMPEDLQLAIAGLKAGIESGRISVERIDESLRRILRIKQKRGILEGKSNGENPEQVLGCTAHQQLAQKASE